MKRCSRLDADLVADEERDVELDDDSVDEHGVDKEEISACAPYLARQMSCLGRVTPRVKEVCNVMYEMIYVVIFVRHEWLEPQ